MAKVAPFKQIHSDLMDFVMKQSIIPALIFDDNPNVPEPLRNRQFLFNAGASKNVKKQNVIVIMVLEQKGTQQRPLFTAHAWVDKKDMRMTVMFRGADKLSDDNVDVLINGIKTYIDNYPNKQQPTIN